MEPELQSMRIDDIKGKEVPAADTRKVSLWECRLESFCHIVRVGTCLMMVNGHIPGRTHVHRETHGAKMKCSFFFGRGVADR